MKKAIIICIGLFNSFFCSGQENYCSGAELYSLVFRELNLYKNKATEIEIGYKLDETIVYIIDKLKIFSDNEIYQFKKTSKI